MDYCPEQAQVRYRSKDGKDKKTYLPAATAAQAGDALEWPAAMACHVPERGKQSIRYYGAIPIVLEPAISIHAGQPHADG